VYIELHTASAFSFLDGASLPEALVQRAADLEYPALALLDRDGVYGIPRFHLAARRAGLKAIVGAELTVAVGTRGSAFDTRAANREPRAPSPEPRLFRLPVLVSSREGYRNLCRLVTRMKLAAPKGEGALTLDDLDGHVGGLVALAGRAVIDNSRFGIGGLVDRLVGMFGGSHVCIELQRHLLRDEEADNHTLRDLASAFHLPIVATNGVRFATKEERPLYDVLTCIRHKTTLEQAGRRLSWNAERSLKPAEEMSRLFHDLPEAIVGARELADRLEYTMADLGYQFPEYPVPPGETMASFLRKITQAGARERYRPYHDRARAQIARELDLIEKLDLAGYFLIVWDIVNFCRQQEILVQGRGSAANSAVCYSLGITAVDPVGMDLLFERFLSEERGEWPDIDLDLPSGDRRECVIQHVYEKYGRSAAGAGGPRVGAVGLRVGMTANVITYRGRSAAREVGKSLSLAADQIDRLAKVMNQFEWVDPKETLERNLRDVGIDAQHPSIQRFAELWVRIQDLPRHLGQHSGGMVICQGRLDEIVPLENASMPDRVVVQWDKDDCADMGLVKVDLLGLGMMAVLQDALAMVNGGSRTAQGSGLKAQDPIVDLAHLPPDDPDVYKMLQEADTIGIFQVESRAQMATLPRLKPARFYDIVVEVAIIRPGPIVGQMVHPYLKRRRGVEEVMYPHPSLEPILARTLGVPLFQEQLLRMAMVAAGFSGGEAEELRRAFGFKRSEKRMQQIEGRLRAGMARQGITGDAAEEILRSITSFALYGFPESHAASFALLVYASAYLKAHYPSAFYTAMLNNQPMGFYHPATLVKDAQRRGVRFASIDVQKSDWECRVDPDGRVRLGLMYVNGLRQEVGKKIALGGSEVRKLESSEGRKIGSSVESRRCPKCGCDDPSMLESTPNSTSFCNVCAYEWFRPSELPNSRFRYSSIEDLIARTGVRRDELATLAEIGALNAFGHDRRSALWQIERAVRPAGALYKEVEDCGLPIADCGLVIADCGLATANCRVEIQEEDCGLAAADCRVEIPEEDCGLATADCRVEIAEEDCGLATADCRVEIADSGLWIGAAHRSTSLQSTINNPPQSAIHNPPQSAINNPPQSAIHNPPQSAINNPQWTSHNPQSPIANPQSSSSPLKPMTISERVRADYAGTSLTIGPHPMAFYRSNLALRGVQRAIDLPSGRSGRRVRVAGAVITRQRPGTAKGFVFLTLEDETGIANIIIQPDLFTDYRSEVIGAPYLLVEGTLQIQEGVTSVKAERVQPLTAGAPEPQSRDYR
jgi:error-prone DNA polymerase